MRSAKMEDGQTFLLGFGIFNLCLLIFCRSLSGLVLRFFAFGRRMCPPEECERLATKMGFHGTFTNSEITNPSRKRAIQVLAWTGGINFLGCVVFYLMIATGTFNETRTVQKGIDQPSTHSESK